MKTTVVGSYPKISEDPGVPNMRNSLNRFDQGKITRDDLERVIDQTVARVIKEQEQCGLDEVTDGLIRWDDLADPCARSFGGMKRGGLLRFFDNNVYYRQPLVDGPIAFKPATAAHFALARQQASKPLKAVLPGPFTLASLSQDAYYKNREKLTLALAEALHQEALALQEAGATHIQFDEPSLCKTPGEIDLAREALGIVTRGLKAATSVFVYFGSVQGDLAAGLFHLPVDRIGVDCVSKPGNLDAVLAAYTGGKDVVLGLVDARNTKMESAGDLAAVLKRAAQRIPAGKLWLSPSCGLEFLPHDRAVAKLRLVVQAAERAR